jgi:hypothetical protein
MSEIIKVEDGDITREAEEKWKVLQKAKLWV